MIGEIIAGIIVGASYVGGVIALWLILESKDVD